MAAASVQAKRFVAPQSDIAAVREIIGSISQREFTKGIIITTLGFTSAARQEAERLGVELYDGERLLWMLLHHLHRSTTSSTNHAANHNQETPSTGTTPSGGRLVSSPGPPGLPETRP